MSTEAPREANAHGALVEALREIAAGAVPDYGSDPDYRTRGEMGNIASVALAFLTDEGADGHRTERPIRVFYSELSGRFYASQRYREESNHVVITGKKYDVTNDIAAAVVRHDLEFTPVADEEPTDAQD